MLERSHGFSENTIFGGNGGAIRMFGMQESYGFSEITKFGGNYGSVCDSI